MTVTYSALVNRVHSGSLYHETSINHRSRAVHSRLRSRMMCVPSVVVETAYTDDPPLYSRSTVSSDPMISTVGGRAFDANSTLDTPTWRSLSASMSTCHSATALPTSRALSRPDHNRVT